MCATALTGCGDEIKLVLRFQSGARVHAVISINIIKAM
jgi:hypothetical protein